MMTGEFLTRGTIWITIVTYAIGSVAFALAGRRLHLDSAATSRDSVATTLSVSTARSRWDSVARSAWTTAVISLIAHFIFAFQFYHAWSHDSAYRDTARQTEEITGLNWGGGLFINYAFLTIWIADIAWWWLGGLDSYRARPWPLVITWHALLILIIFNATVVFEDGIVRWLGLAICIVLFLTWVSVATQRSTRAETWKH